MGEADGIANMHVKRGWSLAGMEIGTVGSYLAKLPNIKRRKKAIVSIEKLLRTFQKEKLSFFALWPAA